MKSTVQKKRNCLRANAKKRGIKFSLSAEDVRQLLTQTRCYYTGVLFSLDHANARHSSVDRVDPALGYVKGNVVMCTVRVNAAKSDLTPIEIKALAAKL